jgi:hypothetical protein
MTLDLSSRTHCLLSASRTNLLLWAGVLVLNSDFIQSSVVNAHTLRTILLYKQHWGGLRRGAGSDVTLLQQLVYLFLEFHQFWSVHSVGSFRNWDGARDKLYGKFKFSLR